MWKGVEKERRKGKFYTNETRGIIKKRMSME